MMPTSAAINDCTSDESGSLVTVFVAPVGRGLYSATNLGGRKIVAASRTPLLAAARILLAEGMPPATVIEMRRTGAVTWDLRAPIGVAAGLDVREGPYGPKFVRYREPHEGAVDCIKSTVGAPDERTPSLGPHSGCRASRRIGAYAAAVDPKRITKIMRIGSLRFHRRPNLDAKRS
jgi:hypothetical protein